VHAFAETAFVSCLSAKFLTIIQETLMSVCAQISQSHFVNKYFERSRVLLQRIHQLGDIRSLARESLWEVSDSLKVAGRALKTSLMVPELDDRLQGPGALLEKRLLRIFQARHSVIHHLAVSKSRHFAIFSRAVL
jgi:hypothetical protein